MPNQRLKLKIIFPLIAVCAFFAQAGEVQAATYYVDATNGNDSWTGTAGARAGTTLTGPWKTVGKVNGFNFQTGDDVYFKCGGTWSGTVLQPNLQGISSNQAVIGAYYGSGTVGVSGTRPILDGVPTGTGDSKFGTVPTKGTWSGLLNIPGNRSYVTVQDMQVQWSGGDAITFAGGSHNVVNNCFTLGSYRSGIRIDGSINEVSYCLLEKNTVSDSSRVRIEDPNVYGCAIGIVGGNPAPPWANNNVIRYNYVYNNRGEGIDLIKGTSNNIVEYNTVLNSRSANIYFDRQSVGNVARYNMVYGYSGAPWPCSAGIAIQDEQWSSYAGSEGNKIYGNMIANANFGINFDAQHPDALIKDTEIYNNTIVDCGVGIKNWSGPYVNSYVKNNIVWCTGIKTPCTMTEIPTSHPGLTFGYNYWSELPDVDAQASTDYGYSTYYNGDPQLNDASIAWNALIFGQLAGSEFALTSGSPARGKGANLGAPYNHLLNLAASNFKTNTFNFKDQPAAGAWDIGAGVYVGGDTQAPAKPSLLSVR